MAIIQNPAERVERAQAKRHALLRFLRDELYTNQAVAGLVMGVGERAARQTVAAMEAAGLVRRQAVNVLPGLPPVTLVAITSHGQAMAFDPERETVSDRVFEPGKYSLVHLAHRLDTQRLRVEAMQSGRIQKWVPGEALGKSAKNIKRPDALLLTVDKTRVAIEVERTIKNRKRYAGILENHLTAIKQNKWSRVVWTSPDQQTAARLEAILKSIKHVNIAGISTQISDAHLSRLTFCTYDDFVNQL